MTHTNLVLLPKKLVINTFSDMSSISLSNFLNKIFSRIIHERIKSVLPDIIFEEQEDSVQGRSIAENILMVQKIVANIRKRGKILNLVIKLDMMKAYDRVDWLFLTKVLRNVGFGERLIDMDYRLVGNNWYSISKGFFRSYRGLNQGDPLSPTFFIIAAKVMFRALKSLIQTKEFKMFRLPRGSPK